MLAKIFDDYSDPAEPLPPCETAKNGVSCYGKFTGSIQKWSDKTFQEVYQVESQSIINDLFILKSYCKNF